MSSLTGFGKAGFWSVDIDTEDADGRDWSITIRHPVCYIQSALPKLDVLRQLCRHLKSHEATDELIRLGETNDFELLAGVVDDRLLFRMGRVRSLVGKAFPWLLECVVDVQEADNLAMALEEALLEAETPEEL